MREDKSEIKQQIEREQREQLAKRATSPQFEPLPIRRGRGSERGRSLTSVLDQSTRTPEVSKLGPVELKTDIESTLSPFQRLPEYKTQYPPVVKQALGELYAEYNLAFAPLVEANREWPTDYQYCMTGPNGTPVNYFAQIDMVGLPSDFLQAAGNQSVDEVREVLRGRIFEFENSLAMYQLVQEIFSNPGQDSELKRGFRASMDALKQRFGKKIAILTVTDEKYEGVKSSEFGKHTNEPLADADVLRLSGFDKLFDPQGFRDYLEQTGGECEYLLVVRSSDPMSKLRNPNTHVDVPLLEDPETRRIIKAHTLTCNVDAPEMDPARRMNDTKEYFTSMGLGHEISSYEDIDSPEFRDYLLSEGITLSEDTMLRAKPLKGTYGAYGHVSGTTRGRDFRHDLKKGLQDRGRYIIQPERETPTVTNETNGVTYTYIDRNFVTVFNGEPMFLGGVRTLMPIETVEAKRKRIHGNGSSVFAEIS